MIEEIAKRLLVIVRDSHWNDDSFVKLGPLRYLERLYGSESVYVVDDKETCMHGSDASCVDKNALKRLLSIPLTSYFEKKREPTTFSVERPGHIIKLIVGLIQDYGALKLEEITHALSIFKLDISSEKIGGYLLCAKSVGWIAERRKGSFTFFLALDYPDAANLPLKSNASIKNKPRRRLTIIEYWSKEDPLRHAAIIDLRGGASQ